MKESIFEIVRNAEDNYINGTTNQGKYVTHSMYETVERIRAYLNSQFVDGKYDSLGREKPFYNEVIDKADDWYNATDVDRKNLKLMPRSMAEVFPAFVATTKLQLWMDDVNFGSFLNKWGRVLSRFCSAIVKFVEKDGQLIPTVVPWGSFVPDPVNFDAIPKIEKLYFTPQELRNNVLYDQKVVEELIASRQTRKNSNGQEKDNQANFVEVYEVHGELPENFLTDEPIEDITKVKYRQQMHHVAFTESTNGEYNDFTLYKGKEAYDPYMLTHLIEEDDRTLGIGPVERAFDSQWMKNHAMKAWKDSIDLAKKFWITDDPTFATRNAIGSVEWGDILTIQSNRRFEAVNTAGVDVSSIQAFSQEWGQNLAKSVTKTPDAIRGETFPSGTAYRAIALQSQIANTNFAEMTQNKGLYLEQMLKRFVIPFIKKGLENKDEVVAILDDAGVRQIDSLYIPKKAVDNYNKKSVDKILNTPTDKFLNNLPQPFNQQQEEADVSKQFAPLGNMRSIKPDELDQKTWKEVLQGKFWDNVRIEITSENNDKETTLTTLATLSQTYAQTDPEFAKLIRNKVAIETGVVSPLEISSLPQTPNPSVSPPGGVEGLKALVPNK